MFEDFLKSPKWESARMMIALLVVIAAAFFIVTNLTIILSMLGAVWTACLPFVIGGAIAYVLNLLMVKWEQIILPKSSSKVVQRIRRPICLLLSVAIIAGIIAIVSYSTASELSMAVLAIGDGVNAVIDLLKHYVSSDSRLYSILNGEPEIWSNYIQKIINTIGGTDNITTSLTKVGSSVVSSLMNGIIAFVFALYVLLDKEHVLSSIRGFLRKILPVKAYLSCMNTLKVANRCFGRFVYGQCLEACILGTLCAVGLTIFDFPFAAPIGLIVGATSIVPLIGAWVGGCIGAIMIFSVSPQQTVMFVVFLIVLQQLESNLIYPKVVGTSVGLPGVLVLVSVFIGGSLFGVVGVLCAVPVVSTVRTLLNEGKTSKRPGDDIDEDDYVINLRDVATEPDDISAKESDALPDDLPAPIE